MTPTPVERNSGVSSVEQASSAGSDGGPATDRKTPVVSASGVSRPVARSAAPAQQHRDFVDEMIAERSESNPDFQDLVTTRRAENENQRLREQLQRTEASVKRQRDENKLLIAQLAERRDADPVELMKEVERLRSALERSKHRGQAAEAELSRRRAPSSVRRLPGRDPVPMPNVDDLLEDDDD